MNPPPREQRHPGTGAEALRASGRPGEQTVEQAICLTRRLSSSFGAPRPEAIGP